MVPSSEEVEGFSTRLTALRGAIEQRGNVELRANNPVLRQLATLAKEWIMLAQRLRPSGLIAADTMSECDQHMGELFGGAGKARRRSGYYLTRLRAVERRFTTGVVIPVVRHEGDPRQVATRQLRADLAPHVTSQEATYSEEALQCVAEACNRAAIVLLWAAGITRMHNSIEASGFTPFNNALTAIGARKAAYPYSSVRERGPITTRPELQRVADFVILVAGMDVWKYDGQAFSELAALLQTRNNAAHPGMGTPGLLDVQYFASKLIDRVFAVIPR